MMNVLAATVVTLDNVTQIELFQICVTLLKVAKASIVMFLLLVCCFGDDAVSFVTVNMP